jgi:hypothetical protein
MDVAIFTNEQESFTQGKIRSKKAKITSIMETGLCNVHHD